MTWSDGTTLQSLRVSDTQTQVEMTFSWTTMVQCQLLLQSSAPACEVSFKKKKKKKVLMFAVAACALRGL